jgi:hypothetical protein
MGEIFISYRRDDAAGEAGRLYDRLREHFGPERVFRDVDALEPGQRFTDEIEERLADCDVLIALIGKRWKGEADAAGGTRIDDPEDFVRLEIGAALRRGITVVPALVHNAQMPRAEELPPDLHPLLLHHALDLDSTDFHDDVTRLIRALEQQLSPPAPRERPGRGRRIALLAGGATVGIAALVVALALLRSDPEIRLRSEAGALSADQVRALLVERGFYSSRTTPGSPGLPHAYTARVQEGVPVVVDAVTGLMWQQGGSRRLVAGGRQGAVDHVQALNEAALAGFTDWRLPTLEEALALLRPGTPDDFHLHPAFDAVGAPFVWTADDWTEEDGSAAGGWVVYYLDGYAAAERTALNAYVRAVRTQ